MASINRTSLEATISGSELLLVLFVSVLAIAGWNRAFSCVSGMTCLNDLLYYEDVFYIAMLLSADVFFSKWVLSVKTFLNFSICIRQNLAHRKKSKSPHWSILGLHDWSILVQWLWIDHTSSNVHLYPLTIVGSLINKTIRFTKVLSWFCDCLEKGRQVRQKIKLVNTTQFNIFFNFNALGFESK